MLSLEQKEGKMKVHPPSVLVVDDSPAIREMFVDYFREAKKLNVVNIEVVEAQNGIEALEKIAAKMPDLVITDILMPLMDGLQLIEELRMLYETLPIMVITALGDEVTQNRLTELRKHDMIDWTFLKPLSMTSVLTKIKALLRASIER